MPAQFYSGFKLLKRSAVWLIFLACIFVYVFNSNVPQDLPLVSQDTTGNSLIAFNWLFNGRLDFDNFRQGAYYSQGQPAYFLSETKSGHLVSTYPIGTAIVSFPLYVCFALFLWVSHGFSAIDITSVDFIAQRLFFEQLAAALMTSFSVVLFYQLSRIRYERSIALITTFIYAFATNVWVNNSQALWQHSTANLVLIAIMLCLFKADRAPAATSLLLLNAGILAGFLMTIRLTNVIFVVAVVGYVLNVYRRRSILLFLGLSTGLIGIGWNLYYFRNLTGGYGELDLFYRFTLEQFGTNFVGLLFSPSRGLLFCTPILLLSLPGLAQAWKRQQQHENKLLILLLFACLALFLQYCFFRIWWAGTTYGARFLTDALPILCFAINGTVSNSLYRQVQQGWRSLSLWLTAGLLVFSVSVQVVGIFGANGWDGLPVPMAFDPYHKGTWSNVQNKFWQFRDSQIERSARTLMFRITHPTGQPQYAAGLAGRVIELRDQNKQPFSSPVKLAFGGELLRVYATVQNTGTSTWYGYQTGADYLGEARVRVSILDAMRQPIAEQRLYISGEPKPGESAIAIGDIFTPKRPGKYVLVFSLISERILSLPSEPMQSNAATASLVINVPEIERGV